VCFSVAWLSRFLLSSWPVPSHCEGTSAFLLSPLFLARSLPLRGNPGFPAFSLFFLARSLPLRGNPGLPAVREPRPSRFLSPSFLRPEQKEPAASRSDRNGKSQQRPGPTGKTVSTSRALLRHPPGTLLQVTDTVPERFRRHQVPTPPFLYIV
jgi:hypothetical protein